MKNLILISTLLLTFSIAQTQTTSITQLDEIEIGVTPLDVKIHENGNRFTFNIGKVHSVDFVRSPIAFMNSIFDIESFIALKGDNDYDSYILTLDSTKGSLVAEFDAEGQLLKTKQNFKDILLPYDVRCMVYKENKGWTMIKNNYMARTRGEVLTNEIYKVTLVKDNERRTLKYRPSLDNRAVASLE